MVGEVARGASAQTQRAASLAHSPAPSAAASTSAAQVPGQAAPAPASATPVPDLVELPSSDEGGDAAADALSLQKHQMAEQDGAKTEGMGFFKGLLAKAKEFMMANKGSVLGGAVLLGGLSLATGGAAFVPALIGLAVSAATHMALGAATPQAQATGAPADVEAGQEAADEADAGPAATSVKTPLQFEEEQRRLELERKLAQQQDEELASFMAPADQPTSTSSRVEQQEADLLGLNEAPSSAPVQAQASPAADPFNALWDEARQKS